MTDKLDLVLDKLQTIFPFVKLEGFDFRQYILSLSDEIRSFLVPSTTGVIRGTTQVITDFLLVILAMYYFFKEGPAWLKKGMQLTPLSNKYDQILFKKFREVSVSSVVVTLIVAVIQGALGGLAFFLIGVPAFFLAIVMAFFSLVPVVGTPLFWLPASIILISVGEPGKGIFLFLFGALVIATSDNLLRAWLMKGKAQVHPLFVFLSLLGGIAVFGFWGIIYGPLILSLTLTLLHIYELEYGKALEK